VTSFQFGSSAQFLGNISKTVSHNFTTNSLFCLRLSCYDLNAQTSVQACFSRLDAVPVRRSRPFFSNHDFPPLTVHENLRALDRTRQKPMPIPIHFQLSSRQQWPEWHLQLQYHVIRLRVWHLLDPNADNAPDIRTLKPGQNQSFDMLDACDWSRKMRGVAFSRQ
jgi:hypothetical protein